MLEPLLNKIVSRDQWIAARKELLAAEKERTHRGDKLAKQRLELPWVRIDKEYRCDTGDGAASLADWVPPDASGLPCHSLGDGGSMYQWLDRAPKGRNENGLVSPPRRVRGARLVSPPGYDHHRRYRRGMIGWYGNAILGYITANECFVSPLALWATRANIQIRLRAVASW
jgi:Bacterial protein of unknown function (DUF899)